MIMVDSVYSSLLNLPFFQKMADFKTLCKKVFCITTGENKSCLLLVSGGTPDTKTFFQSGVPPDDECQGFA